MSRVDLFRDSVFLSLVSRKCQLVTTGPWQEMPNLALIDISMQPDVEVDWDGPIALWAIGSNGDVLTRLGVSRHCPEVSRAVTDWPATRGGPNLNQMDQ